LENEKKYTEENIKMINCNEIETKNFEEGGIFKEYLD
jgi:hypothetical protein